MLVLTKHGSGLLHKVLYIYIYINLRQQERDVFVFKVKRALTVRFCVFKTARSADCCHESQQYFEEF